MKRTIITNTMAQRRLSQKPGLERIEIKERDQANNLVATYIQSTKNKRSEGIRIDVIVSPLPIFVFSLKANILVRFPRTRTHMQERFSMRSCLPDIRTVLRKIIWSELSLIQFPSDEADDW